jgi:hypothetical protein
MAGAILLYYGDNITYIADNYGKSWDWSEQVIENHRHAATGLACVFFCFAPICLTIVANKYNMYVIHSTYFPFDKIAMVLYILVVTISPSDKIVSIPLIVLCLILIVIYYCSNLDYNSRCAQYVKIILHVLLVTTLIHFLRVIAAVLLSWFYL